MHFVFFSWPIQNIARGSCNVFIRLFIGTEKRQSVFYRPLEWKNHQWVSKESCSSWQAFFNWYWFFIHCILDMLNESYWIFGRKGPANLNFNWIKWNSCYQITHFKIILSCSSILNLKYSPAQGFLFWKL